MTEEDMKEIERSLRPPSNAKLLLVGVGAFVAAVVFFVVMFSFILRMLHMVDI